MKPYVRRSGLAIIVSIITIFLFFNANNLGSNYYNAATAISQARADYGDMLGLLDQLDQAVMDFSRGGVIKDTTREIGKGAGGLLDGLGKFLASLADETPSSSQPSQQPQNFGFVDPEVDETVKKMREAEAERLAKDKERAGKNEEAIKSFREKIKTRQEASRKIESDIPSAFWQWMLFVLSLFATIVAWYEAFFLGHQVVLQSQSVVPVQSQPIVPLQP